MKRLFLILSILLWASLVYATCNYNIGIFGQSNGGQMTCPYTTQMVMPISLSDGCGTATANAGVYMWNSTGSSVGTAWVSPGTGSNVDSVGIVALGNAINNATGCTVHIVDVTFGGSSIFQTYGAPAGSPIEWWWNSNDTPSTDAQTGNTGSSYASSKAKVVAATGGALDIIILMNGEVEGNMITPINAGFTQTWFNTHLHNYWTQLKSDFTAPLFIQSQLATCGVASCTQSANADSAWSNLREWNKSFVASYVASYPHTYIGDTTVNFALGSYQIHWTPAGYAQAGLMLAQTILYDGGFVTWYKGPSITGLNAVDSTHTDILIQHSGGTDFTPTSSITGFAETCGGSTITISEAIRQTASSIRLTHDVCTGTRVATYMYGIYPNVAGVVDNSTLIYPLEPNINITQIAGTTYTITGTVSGAVQSGVTVNLTGTSSASTTTAGDGTYSFTGLSAGSYTITPSKTGYTFSPANISATISTGNLTGENFTASSTASTPSYVLSGGVVKK